MQVSRLDVGVRSVGEGATQQQSGGVVLASGTAAWPVLEARVELHQYKNLRNTMSDENGITCRMNNGMCEM